MFCILLPFLKQNWRIVHEKPAESRERGIFQWWLALEVESDSGMGLRRFMLVSLNKLIFMVWRALGEGSWGHIHSWYWLVSLLFFQTRNILGLRRLLRSFFHSRTHLPLLVAMYLLALHVLLFLCFTGHLWTGITACVIPGPEFPIDRIALHPAAFFFQSSP